ncbi:hypothetical protein JOB18_046152 [Solea senegalensis]|uniref:Uncharacterized protein n=1 Tax=Solea senegalensis TaxID=28829 RepID=A0AAV6SUX4_SOLSE|nr:hypothetical protein JOB18_046152 [Solea senegalensis]
MITDYCRTLSVHYKKTHAKSSNCTVTVCLTQSVQLQAKTTLCTLGLEQYRENSHETLPPVVVILAPTGQKSWLLAGASRHVRVHGQAVSVQSGTERPLTNTSQRSKRSCRRRGHKNRGGPQQCNSSSFIERQ